jgi:type IV pilus assembly protein PilQ
MRTTVKERRKIRAFWIVLLLWAVLIFPNHVVAKDDGGEINQVKVEETQKEASVIIQGGYRSYRAFTLDDPARLVIDMEGARLMPDVARAMKLDGDIVSEVRIGQGDGRTRLVLNSTREGEHFHFNIGEKDGTLWIKCWRPNGAMKKEASAIGRQTGAKESPKLPNKALREVLGMDKAALEPREDVQKVPKYPGKKIYIDFFQADLHNVFRLFGEITGKNFIVDDTVTGTLTLSLREVPWDLALDIITDMKGLEREERHDILVIRPKAAGRTQGELVVKTVSDEVLHPARLLKKEQDNEQRARDLILKAHNLEIQGRLDKALDLYEAAYDLWRTNIDLVKKTAYLHYSMGHYARSYFFAKEALKLNMQDAESALYAALSSAQMEKAEEAGLFFEAAINAKPKLREAFYNYGLFLEEQQNYEKAGYIYHRYEEIFGPSLDVSLAIARVYEGEHRNGEACKRYREISFSGFSLDKGKEQMVQEKMRSLCGQGG